MRARLLVTLFLAACTRTETVTRFVTLHQTQSCVVPPGSFGKYLATGDFEPLPENLAAQPLAIDVAGLMIEGVPGNVQSLALQASAPDLSTWLAASLVPNTGDVDMLLLPSSSACALVGKSVPFDANMTFVAVSSHTLITTGTTSGTQSFRMDLDTGRVVQMSIGIGKQRTHAAAASLGDGRAFIIGGVSEGAVQGSVEIYDDALSDFDATRFQLVEARSDHGAVTLANGDVLVAGGHASAAILATERLTFDGTSWRAAESTLPLDTEHLNPFVLRLADGTVMVGGGTDDSGNGVGEVEFFSADATTKLAPTTVPASAKDKLPTHAFVALDGGGALFV
ncbi:MAG TPA: hypothetical protein VH054_30220, partial [Polyangiaceae bacterium]|nr:hypothetical protein [Polyangiaceae bacterium]